MTSDTGVSDRPVSAAPCEGARGEPATSKHGRQVSGNTREKGALGSTPDAPTHLDVSDGPG